MQQRKAVSSGQPGLSIDRSGCQDGPGLVLIGAVAKMASVSVGPHHNIDVISSILRLQSCGAYFHLASLYTNRLDLRSNRQLLRTQAISSFTPTPTGFKAVFP
ncbi:hypothetical protein QE152_g26620 [Popillia japonica]|uniref:Uncharacterized protein n=1 Tax=Popillia japonica TaxID=7064 RepID=A0AAW1JX74_POPJA